MPQPTRIRKGTRVLIDKDNPADSWTGYAFGGDKDYFLISETPLGHEPICIEKHRVTVA